MSIIRSSFRNNFGKVYFEDGTVKEMTYDEYLILKRGFTPKTVSKLIRYVESKCGFYDSGHRRTLPYVWTDEDYYWFHGKDLLIKDEYIKMMKLIKRYQRLRHYIKEIKPEWKKVDNIYWADNSIDEIQRDKFGNERKIMIVGPHGDCC